MTPTRDELQQQMTQDAYRAAAAAYRAALRTCFTANDAAPEPHGEASGRAIAAGDALRRAHSRLMRARLDVRPAENPEPAADRIYRAEHRAYIRKHGQPGRPRPTNPRTVAAHERRTH